MGELLTQNTALLRQEVAAHVADDKVRQKVYWDTENQRGCFIGCLNHSDNPTGAEVKYGIPVMVQRIAESIFERLPAEEAVAFFAAFPDAVGCDGKDLSRVGWQFLAAELRTLPPQEKDIQAVIDPVIAGIDRLASGMAWDAEAARVAAEAASWAARAAAWAAAWAAEDAAEDAAEAAEAAEAAARAARAAAEAAAWAARAFARAAEDAAGAAAEAAEAAAWAARVAAEAASWAARAAARAFATRRQRNLLLRLIAEAEVRHD